MYVCLRQLWNSSWQQRNSESVNLKWLAFEHLMSLVRIEVSTDESGELIKSFYSIYYPVTDL
jgi:hypothetical protein